MARRIVDGVERTVRGTSNGNSNGNSESRRRRRAWLVKTYRADRDLLAVHYTHSGWVPPERFVVTAEQVIRYASVLEVLPVPACRCYRCGRLLHTELVLPDGTEVPSTLTVDRIVPGKTKTAKYPNGGTYVRENIRPACGPCNSLTGAELRRAQ